MISGSFLARCILLKCILCLFVEIVVEGGWTKAEEKQWIEYRVDPRYDVPWLDLQQGQDIPQLGMGTYASNGSQLVESVEFAIHLGYRMFETSSNYENGADLVKGISQTGIHFRHAFITSSIHPNQMDYETTAENLQNMLRQLGRKYINLCLLDGFGSIGDEGKSNSDMDVYQSASRRQQMWKALEDSKDLGVCLSIGVINYELAHLKELMAYARHIPAANEIEFHPYFIRNDLLAFCRTHHIVVIAYGSISPKGLLFELYMNNYILIYVYIYGIVVIPKSNDRQHIADNAHIFDFTMHYNDISKISQLNQNKRFFFDYSKFPALDPNSISTNREDL
ncbi:aldo-keto reductase [Reticulomyxa filosa]|uniref:Aldo-keto reductase n=1 Tax=Reticulomyxa filosa TaxID=46433 RepID=X6MIC0_RETFI|nr:aldo-keto reductase [Reticulomyxa filosa]|eukprot:ETO13629.1 aldo-keto reductase [Reticulomyxa filosa]